jgi:hypothetical protein
LGDFYGLPPDPADEIYRRSGRGVDTASDVAALGLVLAEALTGMPLTAGGDRMPAPGLTAGMADLLRRAMTVGHGRTAGEFMRRLSGVLSQTAVAGRRSVIPVGAGGMPR